MKIDIDINELYEELSISIKSPEMSAEISEIIAKLKAKKETNIVGILNEKMYILKPKDIVLFYTEGSKVMVDTMEESYEVKKKLYQIEDELKGESFVRISKSAIANVQRVENIEIYFNGSLLMKFENGSEEIISRRYVSKVKAFIGLGGK